MIYINQIHLIQKGIKQNRKFLKSLYNCEELSDANKWLDCSKSGHRIPDNKMTLEKFLKQINQKTYIMLQIGSPDPFDIRYGAFIWDTSTRKNAYIHCPYSANNFNIIEELYENSFGSKLTGEPIPDEPLEYYQRQIASYPKP